MLWQLWQNPEFVRHQRAELRKGRALAVGVVVAIVLALTALVCWAQQKSKLETLRSVEFQYSYSQSVGDEQIRAENAARKAGIEQEIRDFEAQMPAATASNAYRALLWMQFGVLSFWSLLSCAQGVSRERERGTWDFQRTTRLLPSELLIGKLLGEPVLAYFIVLCALPLTVVLGFVGRIKFLDIVSGYFVILIAALFIGLAGLWLSSLFESKSRGIGLIGAIAMYAVFLGITGVSDSSFSGLAALSPLITILRVTGHQQFLQMPRPTLFGDALPWAVMTFLLYLTFGGWIVLMLLRTVKKDLGEVRLLSNWQAVGCCAFLNFVLYATFNPSRNDVFAGSTDFVAFIVAMNGLFLFFLGLTMLGTSERLQTENLSQTSSLLSVGGLQWPWLLISGTVSYLLLIWGLFAWKGSFEFDRHVVATSALRFLVVLAFANSNVLFIQWCKLTRMRAPLLKGVLYLFLYYGAAGVICGVMSVGSNAAAIGTAMVLTPFAAFQTDHVLLSASTMFGIALQLTAIGFLISAVRGRVRQPQLAQAAAA
ncbi:MAG TPA: ABC transporter permease [Terriglobales bacterium]|nr:ABC transporter permease [Terriglobales bacterium]